MADWTIRRLDKDHDRSAFDCGQPMLNEWLKDRAVSSTAVTFHARSLLPVPTKCLSLGTNSVSTHRVVYEALPAAEAKGLPRLDVPVVLIGRLAVDHTVQGQGLGALLLVDALRRSLQISEQVGIRAVEVDALDEAARNFYLKFGFRSLAGRSSAPVPADARDRKLKLGPI